MLQESRRNAIAGGCRREPEVAPAQALSYFTTLCLFISYLTMLFEQHKLQDDREYCVGEDL
jgi:hypothetical protein